MTTITLKDHVLLLDDSRVIVIQITHGHNQRNGGVFVTLDNLHRPGWDCVGVAIPWDKTADVDFLYEHFNQEAVCTFKRLCEMLAQAGANQHTYEVLI